MASRRKKGLSISDAFRRFADPTLLARLDELEPHSHQYTAGVTEHLFDEYRQIHEAIDQALADRLESGELIARGLVRGSPVTEGKIDVAPERWADLHIHHELDEIIGRRGFEMTAVEIREAEPNEDEEPTGGVTGDLDHDPDYRWVRVRGVVFRLGPIQARIVRRLHDASRTGQPWLNGKELLRHKPAIASRSIRDLFKSKPNWTELIRSDGRGSYRLNLP